MKTLYLGTDPSHYKCEGEIVHFPVIKIVPRCDAAVKEAFADIPLYTHLIFTSKNAVRIFFEQYKEPLKNKVIVAIGKVTSSHLISYGYKPEIVAKEETQEGLIDLLKNENLQNSYFFLPRSSLSRPVLTHFFESRALRYKAVDLYDTHSAQPDHLVKLEEFDQIVFTSPSTVDAFFQLYSTIPVGMKIVAVGPVTDQALARLAQFQGL